MIVGAAREQAETTADEACGERLGIGDDLALVGLELRASASLKATAFAAISASADRLGSRGRSTS